ncbi:hypothetical protein GCM10011408_21840 [Dyella caseinilytica]|nr:hypothetical protein GCM10011408_21840 [Dyella caseinilytica]
MISLFCCVAWSVSETTQYDPDGIEDGTFSVLAKVNCVDVFENGLANAVLTLSEKMKLNDMA